MASNTISKRVTKNQDYKDLNIGMIQMEAHLHNTLCCGMKGVKGITDVLREHFIPMEKNNLTVQQ